MSGYIRTVLARLTPDNGLPETVDLSAGFTVNGYSRNVLTKTEVNYADEQEQRQDVNQAAQNLRFGFRPAMKLQFDIRDMSHYTTVAKVASRLMDPGWRVELSLDGGVTYRDIVLTRGPALGPFRGVTRAGVRVTLEVETRDTTDQILPMGAGTLW